MRIFCRPAAMALLALVSCTSAHATIRFVHPDSTYSTIQAGLNAANAGDTVLVARGTYYETLVWPSRPNIKLMSQYGPEETIINANGEDRVIDVFSGLGQTTLIDGFTITNGWAHDSSDWWGGGVRCASSSPTIRNNIITDNSATNDGGGVDCYSSSAVIIGNVIRNNGADRGGGLFITRQGNVMLMENLLRNNNAGEGGGVAITDDAGAVILYSQFQDNNGSAGGAIFAEDTHLPQAHFCNITGNEVNGVHVPSMFEDVDAEYNWWGHPAGPDSGDGVTLNVDYSPWLTSEIVFDIGIVGILEPSGDVREGLTYAPRITVRNNCNYNYFVTFFTAKCAIGEYEDYVRVDHALPQDSTTEVAFKPWMVPFGQGNFYTMQVSVRYAVDLQTANDTLIQTVTVLDANERHDVLLREFTLCPNYPNPFNSATTFEYIVPKESYISLRVYDILGREVVVLVDGLVPIGHHRITWDCNECATGVYLLVMSGDGFNITRKALLLR
ncbi:MAG: T9SS type A sorting domain-containing protein [bacterium]